MLVSRRRAGLGPLRCRRVWFWALTGAALSCRGGYRSGMSPGRIDVFAARTPFDALASAVNVGDVGYVSRSTSASSPMPVQRRMRAVFGCGQRALRPPQGWLLVPPARIGGFRTARATVRRPRTGYGPLSAGGPRNAARPPPAETHNLRRHRAKQPTLTRAPHTRGGPSAGPRAASSARTGYCTALPTRPRARGN